jgi:hypothetical protein
LYSNSIIWLPSQTFFRFITRRFIELHYAHLQLALKRPKNYGTLSVLFLHLMRQVIVNTPRIPTYLRSTLNYLAYDANTFRFGMFFLHDFNLEDMRFIDDNIGEEDCSEVLGTHRKA